MVRAERREGWGQVPVKMFWNASSTLLASRADVSMNERWFSPVHEVSAWISLHALLAPHRTAPHVPGGRADSLANALASSVGTARRCRKSLLLPTNMMTIFASAWSRSSLSHRVTFSYVWCLLIS